MSIILWKIALREIRGGLNYLSYFFICIALATAGTSGVLGFSAGMKREVDLRARSLMAGDLEVRSHSKLKSQTGEAISHLLGNQASKSEIRELTGMAFVPESGSSQLVEIKSISPTYPLYGKLSPTPEGALSTLFEKPAVLVEESLLLKLALKLGDSLRIGDSVFTILGVIVSEPDRLSGPFSLGPRLMMSQASLDSTKLVQPGSRVRYRYIFKIPEDMELQGIVEKIKALTDDSRVEVSDYRSSQKRFIRFFNNVSSYLRLLVIMGMTLGGVGVSMHLFMQKKMSNIAVLKTLGAGSLPIMGIYLRVVFIISLTASLMGGLSGSLIQLSISSLFKALTPFSTSFSLSPGAVMEAILVALTTSLIFSMGPLLKVRSLKPSLILLKDVDERFRRKGKKPFIWVLLTSSGLSLIILLQAGSLSLGATFIGVITGAVLLLMAVTTFILYLIKKIPLPKNPVLKMGIKNTIRPGNTTVVAVTAIGIMSILIMTLSVVKFRILKEIEVNISKKSPSFYFIDIQKDQKREFNSIMAEMGVEADTYPIIRGRLHSLDGILAKDLPMAERKNRWQIKREYAVTTKLHPSPENRVIDGKWWSEDEFENEPLLSVEEDIAKSLGIGVGSTVELDIQGKILRAHVTSTRRVDWSGLTPNFFMVFTKKALSNFTHSYVASARVIKEREIELQDSMVATFPNITVINVRTILETLHKILNQLSKIVDFLGRITILISFVLLLAVLGLAQAYSFKELKIMRALGATTLFIGKIRSVEYGIIGVIAGLVSLGVSLLLSFLVIHFFIKLSFEIPPLFFMKLLTGTLLFTLGAGFVNIFFLYKRGVSRIYFE